NGRTILCYGSPRAPQPPGRNGEPAAPRHGCASRQSQICCQRCLPACRSPVEGLCIADERPTNGERIEPEGESYSPRSKRRVRLPGDRGRPRNILSPSHGIGKKVRTDEARYVRRL